MFRGAIAGYFGNSAEMSGPKDRSVWTYCPNCLGIRTGMSRCQNWCRSFKTKDVNETRVSIFFLDPGKGISLLLTATLEQTSNVPTDRNVGRSSGRVRWHPVGDHKELFVSVQYCCYFLCFKYAVYSCTEIQYYIHSYFVIIAHTHTILWTFLNCTAVSAGSVLCGQILAFPNDYFVSVNLQTIEMSMSVCLCPCACVKKQNVQTSPNFHCRGCV